MTDAQLQVANAKAPKTAPRLRFNHCELVATSCSAVCAGVLNDKAITKTRLAEIQCLSNSVVLGDGEELLLRIERPVVMCIWYGLGGVIKSLGFLKLKDLLRL